MKVKNAEATTYNGITFKSRLECNTFKLLIEEGFNPIYECDKFILQEGFYPNTDFYTGKPLSKITKKVLQISYTPDFIVEHNGITNYIETKGFKTDSYNIKIKLFRRLIDHVPNCRVFEVNTLKQLKEAIQIIKNEET